MHEKFKMNFEQESIEILQKYIQIESVSSTTDYADCVTFLKNQALSLSLDFDVVYIKPNRPVVILKWPGLQPHLPAILLNSHMDVVPVEPTKWSHPPFAAHIDSEGRIYGRGTQDMKSLGIQYVQAIKKLKSEGRTLARTIVLTFVPEEELGGVEGMKPFVQTQQFRDLNIGFGLDEGVASTTPGHLLLFYAEKHKWSVKFHCTGDVGHGCLNMPNTAAEKLSKLLHQIYAYRQEQLVLGGGKPYSSHATAINATIIQGGAQENVIPSEFTVNCDVRLPPTIKIEEWKAILEKWCRDSGDGVWYEEVVCEIIDKPTPIDETNPFYQPFVDTVTKLGYQLMPEVCFGNTDARYLRNVGIPMFGISCLTGSALLHQHDEFIGREEFLKGIEFYYLILLCVGNLIV